VVGNYIHVKAEQAIRIKYQ